MPKIIASLLAAIALAGCATTSSGPMPAGENMYVLSHQEGAFPTGNKPLLANALKESNDFCVNRSKKFKLVSTHENNGPFIFGNYPKATVTFMCNDPQKATGGL